MTDLALSSRPNSAPGERKVFTVRCNGDGFGLPIDSVQTIFRVGKITPVPLAPPEILGLINLRGRINTAASLRRILGMPEPEGETNLLAICIERRGELFSLIVDKIGDVVEISEESKVHQPPNIDRRRAALTSGVYRVKDDILPVLDVDALFDFTRSSGRAAHGQRQEGACA